jgi:F-type H+-transporting ATPase subunit gamma
MANLKALKSRIKSVRSTQKMTKAMKMVAAVALKRAKHAVEESRPYTNKIAEMISDLAGVIAHNGGLEENFPLLTGKNKNNSHLLVVLSSDRGLCGGLNSSIVKYTKNHVAALIEAGKEVKIFCVGKKAYEQLRLAFRDKIHDHIFGIFKSNIEYKSAKEIATKLTTSFEKDEFDVCEIIYNRFKSALLQEPTKQQLIPAPISIDTSLENLSMPIKYEPSKEEILSEMLPKNLAIQIYNKLLENRASEQGARMAAMEAATNNASKMIKFLTLVYNRTRQANITKELIDIISGANTV